MPVWPRRFAPLLLATLAVAACGSGERAGLGADARRELAAGGAYAQRLALAGRAGVPDDQSTIALGYLERLRLGLGSPFRLADYALHDPRLSDAVRRPLGWALLDRILTGQDYHIDPAALDRVGVSPAGFRPGIGRYHLALIEAAVAETADPRAGELAVRLAYELAAAEGSVWQQAPGVVAQAAALWRDRALARADAQRLLRAAQREHADALDLLVRWRMERRFLVEAPRLTPLPLATEREALQLAPRLVMAVRGLMPRLAAGMGPPPPRPFGGARPLLGAAAARRLLTLADSAEMPPETPVVLALRIHGAELLASPGLSDEEQRERQGMVSGAGGEERLAAQLALAVDERGEGDAGLASARLGVAAALRSYAQEEVWFPGYPGPSSRELAERFGVAVSFDRSVFAGWRPYYRRLLEESLADFQRVLPAAEFRGLRVRFGRDPLGAKALALHDPARRVLYLPPTTAAGTIAHELAHDLDWQVAKRRYGVTGGYATDVAARAGRDRLASYVGGLAGAALAPRGSVPPDHLHRPAEVFARNVEWLVATDLARDGMMDGYLSSVQDEMLTGYGSVQRPDLTGGTARALIAILDRVAPLYPDTREWYLQAYGPGRVLSPFDLLRRVLHAPVAGGGASSGAARLAVPARGDAAQPAPGGYPSLAALGFGAVVRARSAGLAAIDAWVCAAPGAMYDRDLERQRRQLVALAAAARAHGIAARVAGRAAGRDGWEWVQRQLYGAPWPQVALDSTTARTLEPLVESARAVDTAGFTRVGDAFRLAQPAARCGTTLPGARPGE